MTAKSPPYRFNANQQTLAILRQIIKYTDDYFADQTGDPIIITAINDKDEKTFASWDNAEALLDFLEAEELIKVDRTYHSPLLFVPSPLGRENGVGLPYKHKLKILQLEPVKRLLNKLESAETRAANSDRKVHYSKRSGTINYGAFSHHFAGTDYKKLIGFLWDKRGTRTTNGYTQKPSAVARKRACFEAGIDPNSERLKRIIDIFNKKMRDKNIPATIKMPGDIYLEIEEA